MSMSIRSHHSVGQGTGQLTSQACAITGVQSGDTLVALIAADTRTVSSVTDDQGNSWSQVPNAANTGQFSKTDIWVATNVKAAAITNVTVTLTGTATGKFGIALYDLTGGTVVSAGSTASTSNTSPFSGPPLTSLVAGIFLAIIADAAQTISVGSPWTLDETMTGADSFKSDYSCSLAPSGSGPQIATPVFTLTNISSPQVCSAVVLVPPAPLVENSISCSGFLLRQ